MSKPKLVITPEVVHLRGISKDYIESLKQWFDVHTVERKKAIPRHEFLNNVKGAFAILCHGLQPMNEEVAIAAGPTLKVISQLTVGFDNIDQEVMKKYSIRVGTAGSMVTSSAAEMGVTILLAASRLPFRFANAYKNDPASNYKPKWPPVAGLESSTVGVVGAGRIGTSIARKVAQFDLKKLMYWDVSERFEMKTLGAEFATLENVFKSCDYIIVSLALNQDTEKIIGRELINFMKPTAIIVNISRGGLIDQDYLVEALQNNRIGGAALDVTVPEPLPPEHPLLHLDNVLITPHIGGSTTVASDKATKRAVENILAVLHNKSMPEELILM